jgi:hypothetical protein
MPWDLACCRLPSCLFPATPGLHSLCPATASASPGSLLLGERGTRAEVGVRAPRPAHSILSPHKRGSSRTVVGAAAYSTIASRRATTP